MEGLLVETTQNVALEYQPASVGERILAYLIDLLVLMAWFFGVSLLMGVFSGQLSRQADSMVVFFVVLLMPALLYDLAMEALFNGQSIGKKALGIRVVMLDGRQPTLSAYLLRWLFRLLETSLFPFFGVIATVTVAVSGKGQRLGDIAAKTTVVKLRPPVTLERVVAVPKVDPDYRVTYPEASTLTDQDATTLRRALQKGVRMENDYLLAVAAEKAKQVTGIITDQDDAAFLRTLLRDHAHLAMQGA